MSDALTGHNAVLGLAEQVDYETDVDATHWLPFVSCSVDIDQPQVSVPVLFTGDAAYHAPRKSVNLKHDVSVDIDTLLWYDKKALLLLLKHAFGEVATTGMSAPYTHTFKLKKGGVVGLTGELYNGELEGLDERAQVVGGIRVNTLEVMFQAQDFTHVKANCIARQAFGMTEISDDAVYADAEEVPGDHVGSLTLGGHSYECTQLGFRINHNLSRRPHLSSKFTHGPQMTDLAELVLFGRVEVVDNQMLTEFLALTSMDGSAIAAGSGNNQIEMLFNDTKLQTYRRPVDKFGVLAVDFEAKCHSNTTNHGIQVAVTNANASAI